MVTDLERQLIQIGQRITDGTASYDDVVTLQSHKREVLKMGDIVLCEQAGITEEEFNKGELNPDLYYKETMIRVSIDENLDGGAFCSIILDDKQKLVIAEGELMELMKIFEENKAEIIEYLNTINNKYCAR